MLQNRQLKAELDERKRELDQRESSSNEELGQLRKRYAQEKEERVKIERRLKTVLNQQSVSA